MMVIVVGDKDGQVDEPHRRPQARMKRRPLEDCRIRLSKERYELTAQIAKLREEIVQTTPIVIGFVSATVGQVGRLQLGLPCKDLPCPAQPKGFEVDEMTNVFLHRPPTPWNRGERRGWQRAGSLLEPRGGAAQSLNQTWQSRGRDREIEGSFEPPLSGSHLSRPQVGAPRNTCLPPPGL
jgi:hypothetical protein